jgi:hypothetical protein
VGYRSIGIPYGDSRKCSRKSSIVARERKKNALASGDESGRDFGLSQTLRKRYAGSFEVPVAQTSAALVPTPLPLEKRELPISKRQPTKVLPSCQATLGFAWHDAITPPRVFRYGSVSVTIRQLAQKPRKPVPVRVRAKLTPHENQRQIDSPISPPVHHERETRMDDCSVSTVESGVLGAVR